MFSAQLIAEFDSKNLVTVKTHHMSTTMPIIFNGGEMCGIKSVYMTMSKSMQH